jgi:hypothetical protein
MKATIILDRSICDQHYQEEFEAEFELFPGSNRVETVTQLNSSNGNSYMHFIDEDLKFEDIICEAIEDTLAYEARGLL